MLKFTLLLAVITAVAVPNWVTNASADEMKVYYAENKTGQETKRELPTVDIIYFDVGNCIVSVRTVEDLHKDSVLWVTSADKEMTIPELDTYARNVCMGRLSKPPQPNPVLFLPLRYMNEQDFLIVEKEVGETPLQSLEKARSEAGISPNTPLAYAGRLDPMASGKLLILVGDECKKQEKYHNLDKEYEFEVLFGIGSDTGDVLGLIESCDSSKISAERITDVTKKLTGIIELPYPHFSSKTVQGKPLHIWTLEGRINEIEIPTKKSEIYKLALLEVRTLVRTSIYTHVSKKIETIPKVTEASKALGNDFRRPLVRESWKNWLGNQNPKVTLGRGNSHVSDTYQIAKFRCVASSGTYMRTLSEVIAGELGTCGLAYSIHRTKIGKYKKLPLNFGFWWGQF
ncbi:hypothetical protein N8083_02015 [Candidatus Pacebacteria bacterium]|nr:hypothetical protein [Candidatus Paceibacterota bacterium]